VHDVANYDEVPDLLRKIVATRRIDLVVFMAGVNFPA
jgi:hypothetical protein